MKWFIWVGSSTGGYGQRDLGFAEFLQEKGEDVTVGLYNNYNSLPLKKVYFDSMFKNSHLSGYREILVLNKIPKKFLDEFDMIYGKFPKKTKAFNVARGIGNYDIQSTLQDLRHKFTGTPIHMFFMKCLRNSDLIISISQEETEWLKSKGFEDILESTNYVDISIFKPLGLEKDLDVLFVGRPDPIKNVVNLRKACKGLGRNLTEIGSTWISQEECAKYYNRAKVTVVPSLHETFGSVVIESLACGTPVIASKYVNVAKITPCILTDTDSESIKEALNKTLIQPNPIKIAQKFNKDKVLNKEYDDIKKHTIQI